MESPTISWARTSGSGRFSERLKTFHDLNGLNLLNGLNSGFLAAPSVGFVEAFIFEAEDVEDGLVAVAEFLAVWKKRFAFLLLPSRLAFDFIGGLIQQYPQLFGAAHTGGFETDGER